ncbi:MAG: hypothetical protein P1U87_12715, partial [Verrucomicrobiales bacterium]|nr:hypothetical protein [Verrucomicrobiales bacterium]
HEMQAADLGMAFLFGEGLGRLEGFLQFEGKLIWIHKRKQGGKLPCEILGSVLQIGYYWIALQHGIDCGHLVFRDSLQLFVQKILERNFSGPLRDASARFG